MPKSCIHGVDTLKTLRYDADTRADGRPDIAPTGGRGLKPTRTRRSRAMTTATATTLSDEIRAYMHADADDVAWTHCDDCGESVHLAYTLEHDGNCPRCAHRAAVESARDDVAEARDELRG